VGLRGAGRAASQTGASRDGNRYCGAIDTRRDIGSALGYWRSPAPMSGQFSVMNALNDPP